MALATCRLIFEYDDPEISRQMALKHWGISTWLEKQMRTMKDEMRGTEVTGIDIVNYIFSESPHHPERISRWTVFVNSLEMNVKMDMRRFLNRAPIDNIRKLFPICAELAAASNYAQLQSVSKIFSRPLTPLDIAEIEKAMQAHEKKWSF